MSTQPKRYQAIPRERGIRKDLVTGKFQALKCINGKRFSKNFDTIREARHWKNAFSGDSVSPFAEPTVSDGITFGQVWQMYQEQVLVKLESSTRHGRLEQAKFYQGMESIPMSKITPQVISAQILKMKNESVIHSDGRRFSFDNELKGLKAIFNWYRVIDYTFINPILKQHKALGRIKTKKMKDKKMTPQELLLFFNTLREKPFWHDFAMVQFAFASRVQETAGIQKCSVDFHNNLVHIKDVVIWSQKTKHFDHLKNCPKNGEMRTCYMTPMIKEILKRRMEDEPKKTGFVFHEKGEPLTYRQIQYQYDWALKKCGLALKYSSTHFIRHTMATITRQVTGSLESVQSVTGHKDQRLVQHYAAINTDVQKDALIQVENFLQLGARLDQTRPKVNFEAENKKNEDE